MNVWKTITSNYYINVAVISWFSAQIIKVLLTLLTTKKVNMERFVGSGGMPSSHSAFTVSIAVAIARNLGFSSPEFALAFAFASVVMYDAMGVRRAAGEQAKVLNRLLLGDPPFSLFSPWNKEKPIEVDLDQLEDVQKEEITFDEGALPEKELKEFLGHTPLEVLGGCILGVIVALLVPLP